MLQCVAVCCSVLQCVAVCYRGLHYQMLCSGKDEEVCGWVMSHINESYEVERNFCFTVSVGVALSNVVCCSVLHVTYK